MYVNLNMYSVSDIIMQDCGHVINTKSEISTVVTSGSWVNKLNVWWFRGAECGLRGCERAQEAQEGPQVQEFPLVPGEYLPWVPDASWLLLSGRGKLILSGIKGLIFYHFSF